MPTPAPSPLTRLKTPAGTPASCSTSANSIADSGDSSEGFSTIVQPVASAGMTFSAIWFIGQFHGVISAHTPIGSYRIRSCGVSGRSSGLELEALERVDERLDVAELPAAGLRGSSPSRRARPSRG